MVEQPHCLLLTGRGGWTFWLGCCWSLTQTGQSQSHLKPEVPCWKQTEPSTHGLVFAKQGYCQTHVAWIPEVSRTSGRPIFLPSSSRCWRQPLNPPYVPGRADTALLTPRNIRYNLMIVDAKLINFKIQTQTMNCKRVFKN